MMKEILSYLKERYNPLSVIVYGSYADGSNNENSDFDALLITPDGEKVHDISVQAGVVLDVFVYPLQAINDKLGIDEFIQVFDGNVIYDTDGIGEGLKTEALNFLKDGPVKGLSEKAELVQWCKKMLLRTRRGDEEGFFRWHWLLTDSLEIACDILDLPYLGPKKSLRLLKKSNPALFDCYCNALKSSEITATEKWIYCLAELCEHE